MANFLGRMNKNTNAGFCRSHCRCRSRSRSRYHFWFSFLWQSVLSVSVECRIEMNFNISMCSWLEASRQSNSLGLLHWGRFTLREFIPEFSARSSLNLCRVLFTTRSTPIEPSRRPLKGMMSLHGVEGGIYTCSSFHHPLNATNKYSS